MSLSMLESLKDAEITWVCGYAAAPLIQDWVDRLILVDERQLLKGNVFSKVRVVLGVWKALFLHSFDLILTAHPDVRYQLLTLLCRGKRRRRFQRHPGRYHGYEYLQLAEAKTYEMPKWQKKKMDLGENLIALTPSLLGLRSWPIEHYVSLGEQLRQKGYRILLVGLEKECSHYFKSLETLDYLGKTTLVEVCALLAGVKLLITHDGGLLHMGHLVCVPTLSLFGPTNPQEFAPPNSDFIMGEEDLYCRPCYDGKKFATCTNNLCMRQISVKRVVERVDEICNRT